MKKIFVAAMLAASAMTASAQVTLYGQMRVFADSTKTGETTVNSVVNNTSRFGISANEKLGDGLSARVVVETSVFADDPKRGSDTQLGDRQSTVGLASKSFSIDLGRKEHFLYSSLKVNDPFTNLYGSIVGDVHNLRGLRVGDSAFVTANVTKNATLVVERSQQGPGAEMTVYGGSAKFMGVTATAARLEQGLEKSTAFTASTTINGTVLSYAHSDNQGVNKFTGDSIGVLHNIDKITAKASYGRTNNGTRAYVVGADYNFSKRTAVAVAYRTVDKPDTANDVKSFGVGLVHRF